VIGHAAFEIALWAIIGGPIALGGEVIFQLIKLKKNGAKFADTQMGQLKQGFDEFVKEKFSLMKNEFPDKINASLEPEKRKVIGAIQKGLNEIKANMNKMVEERSKTSFNAENKKKNDEQNLAVLKSCVSELNEVLFGEPLTNEAILATAKKEMKNLKKKDV
jgi:hypothetical protein